MSEREKRQNGDLHGKIFDERFGGETKSTRGEILGSFHFAFWQLGERNWLRLSIMHVQTTLSRLLG
jgi:hypothetical protein